MGLNEYQFIAENVRKTASTGRRETHRSVSISHRKEAAAALAII
jgi:phosphopantetheinyl transferase (holo-ACP synthase)